MFTKFLRRRNRGGSGALRPPNLLKKLGKLEGLICRGGTQTPELYKRFTIGIFAKNTSIMLDFVEGLRNYTPEFLSKKHVNFGQGLDFLKFW